MEYKLTDLIDIELFQKLQDNLNEIYSFPSAIIDNDGNILTATAWQDICTKFHRINEQSKLECIKSDQYIIDHLPLANPAVSYKCPHGMVDNATPIIIEGCHLANFFTGQLFLEKPDIEFFKKQAKIYGFDEIEYIKAVEKVPIWSREKLDKYLAVIKQFTEILGQIGLNHLKEIENRKILEQQEKELIAAKEKAVGNEEMLRLLVESSDDMITIHDFEGNYLYYSGPAKYCINASDVFGKTPFDFFDSNTAVTITELIKKTAYSGEICKAEIYINWQGKMTWFEEKIYPIKKGDEIISVVKICSDISNRKASEIEIIKAKEKAEQSDRLKTAFLQNMSHEIRTPMNAIMGFSGLLVSNFDNKIKLQKFSDIIGQRCNDLLDIINDILDIAKIESGQLPINSEECNLKELFAELSTFFTEYQNRLEKQQIKLSLQALCDPCDNIIITDKVKLKQIFINLIGNAFKFTEKGRIEGGCKFDENNNLLFYVSDTGVGIPADKQEMVFERFAQLHQGSKMNIGGTGLGLPIVKGLVGLLGGQILLQSEPEKGSTFSFTFPFNKSQKMPQKQSTLETTNVNILLNKTILIVEDDLYNAEYLKEILSSYGLNIVQAEDGKDAIELSKSHTFDLVLMDIRLPDINGYEVTRLMKQHNPQLKIIAQTAYAAQDERQKAFDAGCIDYISKPTKADLLITMISKHLSSIANK